MMEAAYSSKRRFLQGLHGVTSPQDSVLHYNFISYLYLLELETMATAPKIAEASSRRLLEAGRQFSELT
jgi:hypothetical protein